MPWARLLAATKNMTRGAFALATRLDTAVKVAELHQRPLQVIAPSSSFSSSSWPSRSPSPPSQCHASRQRANNYRSSSLDKSRSFSTCSALLSSASTSTKSASAANHQHYDVIIAGGGAVGSVLARLLLDDAHDHSNIRRLNNCGGAGYRRRPIKVALLEQRASPPSLVDLVQQRRDSSINNTNEQQSAKQPTPNARAYALSPTSLSYLGPSVLQSLVKSNRCGIYNAMQIWEHDGPAQLHFVGEDLDGAIEEGRLVNLEQYVDPDFEESASAKKKARPWLGSVIEDAPLVSALWDELKTDNRIDLLDNIQIKSIKAPDHSVMGAIEPPPPVEITCLRTLSQDESEEHTISANLLVAADGANSLVRRTVGNFPMMTRSYGRKAVTCTVELDSSKGNFGMARTAFQRFLPYGPIALLPVWNSCDTKTDNEKENGPIYANVVWSTLPSEANYLLSLSSSEFITALNNHLCQGPNVNPSLISNSSQSAQSGLPSIPFLTTAAKEIDSLLRTANTALTMGTWTESPSRNYFRMPPRSMRVVGPILGFDLTMSHVVSSGGVRGGYTSPRVALVGDAAHTMHPMAGQGLNLGMGDVNSLAALVKEAIDCGMDVGGTNLFLDQYNEERMLKGWSMVGGVHSLHEMFGCSGSVPGGVTDITNIRGGGDSTGGLQSLLGFGRSLGMNAINGFGPVRKALAEVAAGAKPKLFKSTI